MGSRVALPKRRTGASRGILSQDDKKGRVPIEEHGPCGAAHLGQTGVLSTEPIRV
jgi:hypothetical protein